MNITPLTIYLWQAADKLASFLGPLSFFSGLIAVIFIVIYLIYTYTAISDDEDAATDRTFKMLRTSIWITSPLAVFIITFAALLPTSNTIAMMVIIPRISESKVIQQDLPDIYNAAISALKKQLTQEK